MSKREKLRRKLRNNPKGRKRQDIETLLGYFGFILDHISGSHHIFLVHLNKTNHRIVIPIHGQDIKPVYVKQVIEKLDELFPIDDQMEAEDDK